jgi:hypothetical protein
VTRRARSRHDWADAVPRMLASAGSVQQVTAPSPRRLQPQSGFLLLTLAICDARCPHSPEEKSIYRMDGDMACAH